jgi:predicted dehydrogenase
MIRLAVVGAGHWGPNLINNFRQSRRSEVAWVVDRDPSRLAAVAERFPELRTTRELTDVLADAAVDAVVVATPTGSHYEIARAALEAGKHVLVEKPLADSVERSAALCELAARSTLVLMVGHVFVFNTAARYVKRYITSGDLGRIYYISMTRTNLGPIRVDVDAAWDLAAHDISIANHWLDALPARVSARGGSWINPGIADAVFAVLEYPDNVLVSLQASWLNPRKARDITVVGDKQMLTFDDMNIGEPLRIYDKQVAEDLSPPKLVDSFASFRMSVRDGSIVVPKVAQSEPLRNECEHFLDCLLQDETCLAGGAEGHAVVCILDAISRSAREGGRETEVRIP